MHKFVCQDTVEEKVDVLIESKKQSSDELAKRYSEDNNVSFDNAVDKLNGGATAQQPSQLLGLTRNYDDSGNHFMACSDQHCVDVQNVPGQGLMADHYGTPQPYNGTDTNGQPVTNAFTFAPQTPSTTPDTTSAAGSTPAPQPASGGGGSAGGGLPTEAKRTSPPSRVTHSFGDRMPSLANPHEY